MGTLAGRQVLVTGATGFIGGRLVEKLVLEEGSRVRTLVRDFSHASRLARFPLEMMPGGLLDETTVDGAVAGCDTVFHCAHDFRNPESNLEGLRILAEACLRHRVRRLVYTSSISVYEPLPEGEMDESAPAEPSDFTYKNNKIAAERLLSRYREERGLSFVALQPTIVYGPFGNAWTMNPIRELRQARVVLPEDRPGRCNALYVDDCADALILAATRDRAVGERILISGPDTVTWHGFYGAYEAMLGTRSVVYMPTSEIERLSRPAQGVPSAHVLRSDPRRLLDWGPGKRLYNLVWKLAGERGRSRARKAMPKPLKIPNAQKLALLSADTVVRFDRARDLLGYEPRFPVARGMSLTAEFVKWAAL